jgi:L-seryl-tRNA(Ser) seleniumtransferase
MIVGRGEAVARAGSHPLARALRLDKLGLAALEATLRLYRDPALAVAELPVLAMLTATGDELAARAQGLAGAIAAAAGEAVDVEVVAATARVGGGALPLLELPGPAVAVSSADLSPDALAARLRAGDPPVVGRIEGGRLLLDPRTLAPGEVEPAGRAVVAAL